MRLQIWCQKSNPALNEFHCIDLDNPRTGYVMQESQDVFTIEKTEYDPREKKMRYREKALIIRRTDNGCVDRDTSTSSLSNEEINAFASIIPQYDGLWNVNRGK